MVHGILKFTPSIAFRYVLHRCESRDIRCRKSISFTEEAQVPQRTPQMGLEGQAIDSSIPWCFSRRGSLVARRARCACAPGMGGGTRARCQSTPLARTPQLINTFAGSFCYAGFDNDPSAGSPTETLLRLLLPLNDKVQWTSRDVAGSELRTLPRSEH
ncbi:hypothetical protein CQW23_34993 [Capsicum baccatum]|uniref:Uncharacterized protein n=1 Tax=Capsicum baccatum TaxID=33114 RepID=A0A2G2UXB3_CAPBA|nr:hypothetical protein CQW23_34993 [Capsicum baccatum]